MKQKRSNQIIPSRLASSLEAQAVGCCSGLCSAAAGTSHWPWTLCWWQSASHRTPGCAQHWSDREPSPARKQTISQSIYKYIWFWLLLLNSCCMYLFPLVDVKTIILQFLLQNIWEVDVNMDNLLLTFPLYIDVWFNPLEESTCKPSAACSTKIGIQFMINSIKPLVQYALKF